MNELDPVSLLQNFAADITRSEFKELRELFGQEVTEQFKSQISADRKGFVSEDTAQQNFMKRFYLYGGLSDYYERLAFADPSSQHYSEAVDLLKQPIEQVVEKITGLYKCDPDWPICLFDFSFCNLNPKFVALKVKANLDTFIKPDYFTDQKICSDPRQGNAESGIEPENEPRVWVIPPDDLLLVRNRHICNHGEGSDRPFTKAFEQRFAVRDMAMLADHNNFMTFDINEEAEV